MKTLWSNKKAFWTALAIVGALGLLTAPAPAQAQIMGDEPTIVMPALDRFSTLPVSRVLRCINPACFPDKVVMEGRLSVIENGTAFRHNVAVAAITDLGNPNQLFFTAVVAFKDLRVFSAGYVGSGSLTLTRVNCTGRRDIRAASYIEQDSFSTIAPHVVGIAEVGKDQFTNPEY